MRVPFPFLCERFPVLCSSFRGLWPPFPSLWIMFQDWSSSRLLAFLCERSIRNVDDLCALFRLGTALIRFGNEDDALGLDEHAHRRRTPPESGSEQFVGFCFTLGPDLSEIVGGLAWPTVCPSFPLRTRPILSWKGPDSSNVLRGAVPAGHPNPYPKESFVVAVPRRSFDSKGTTTTKCDPSCRQRL